MNENLCVQPAYREARLIWSHCFRLVFGWLMVVYSEGLQILLREKVIPPPVTNLKGFMLKAKFTGIWLVNFAVW